MSHSLEAAWGRTLTMPRESYLPPAARGTDPVDPQGTDIAVWKYDLAGVPYAIAFQGKANKPLWHHRFRNPADRERTIQQAFDTRKEYMARVEADRQRKREWQHDLKVGEILTSSWGYDQTNVDFFEVTDVQGKSVIIRKIQSRAVDSERTYSHVVPVPGRYVGPPLRKVPRSIGGAGDLGGVAVKIEGNHSAYRWNGKPQYATDSLYGH